MTTNELVLFELDVSVPVQQFRIEFTLVEQGGFPFVPEFLLRLLKVSALMPADIARFFGFTPKELSTALLPFLQQGELISAPDGRIALTEKGLRLFAADNETPMVKSRQEYRKTFAFDLLAFSFLAQRPRMESPRCSVVLSADAGARAESETRAESAFQRHLHKIYTSGELCGPANDPQVPELYKISQIRKDRDGYIKVSESYCLDTGSLTFGFSEAAGLPEEEAYIAQRSLQLATALGQSTLDSIRTFADRIEDAQTLDMLGDGGLDFARVLLRALMSDDEPKTKLNRIYGALQLPRNWDRVEVLLKKYADKDAKSDNHPVSLTWLAPAAHDLWGRYARHGQALSSFVESASVKTKGQKRSVFSPRILIPLVDQNDRQARNKALKDCKEAEGVLHGFVESRVLSAIEIISLSDCFAIVLYHLVQPDQHPVPVPFGFITEDRNMVRRIEGVIEDILAEYTEGNVPRYLGSLVASGDRSTGKPSRS